MARYLLPALATLVVCLPSPALAQTGAIDESSAYNRLAAGTGARAWGMAGAQIAVPSDGDVVTWNPAAIGALGRPHVAFSFTADRASGDMIPASYRNPSGQQVGRFDVGSITPTLSRASGAAVDFASFAFPLRAGGRRLVAGFAYDRHLTLSQRVQTAYQFRHESAYTFNYDYAYDASGAGGFDSVAFSVAAELAHGVTVGANLHRWFNGASVPTTESYTYSLTNVYSWTGTYDEVRTDRTTLNVSAFSLDIGGLIRAGDALSFGFVYRGGFSGDVSYSNAASYRDDHTGDSFSANLSGTSVLRMPPTIGAGIALRVGPRLLVAFDHVQTRWSGARIDSYARITADGSAPAPVSYAVPSMKPVSTLRQSDAGRTALGIEYALTAKAWNVPVRAGLFHQQAYVDDGRPAAWGVSAGAGTRRGPVVVDIAWVRDAASAGYTRNSLRTSLGYDFGGARRQP